MQKQAVKPAKAKAPKAPAPPPQPAPTLALALLTVVQQWHQEHGLTAQQFEDALAEVWQSWG